MFTYESYHCDSERGVRRAPELLPEDYRPSNGYHSGSTP